MMVEAAVDVPVGMQGTVEDVVALLVDVGMFIVRSRAPVSKIGSCTTDSEGVDVEEVAV